jgi:hypothetical protein
LQVHGSISPPWQMFTGPLYHALNQQAILRGC